MSVAPASKVVYDEGMFNTDDIILTRYAQLFAMLEEGPVINLPSFSNGQPDTRTLRLQGGMGNYEIALLVAAGYIIVTPVGNRWTIEANVAL